MFPATILSMEQDNPNKLLDTAREVQQIENKGSFVSNIFAAVLFITVSIGLVYFFVNVADGEPAIVYLFPVAFTGAAILSLVQSYRKTKKKLGPSTSDTPFSGGDALTTVTKQPYERASLQQADKMVSWLGALDRTDLKGLSSSVGLKEYVNSAENTLLLVNGKIIALALTQEDFNLLGGSGAMHVIAQFAAADESAVEQKQNLTMLNYKKWPAMIEYIQSKTLSEFVGSHYNFELPFAKISRIEPRTGFINPGVYIHLSDGTTLKYNTMIKGQIEPFVTALKAQGLSVA